jgi:hypothetical protein
MNPEAFVTADEVALHLKITRRQVLQMARQNLIPAHPILFGRRRHCWRFKLTEIDRAIAAVKPKSDIALERGGPGTMVLGSPCGRRG